VVEAGTGSLRASLHPAARQGRYADAPPSGRPDVPGDPVHGAFHTKQVLAGDVAMLEFETTVGKYVNGVDIIRCDETGRIVEFRVMILSLQAIDAVHE
jgi:hypothetical protein